MLCFYVNYFVHFTSSSWKQRNPTEAVIRSQWHHTVHSLTGLVVLDLLLLLLSKDFISSAAVPLIRIFFYVVFIIVIERVWFQYILIETILCAYSRVWFVIEHEFIHEKEIFSFLSISLPNVNVCEILHRSMVRTVFVQNNV